MIALNRVDAKVNIAVRGLQARQSNLISMQITNVRSCALIDLCGPRASSETPPGADTMLFSGAKNTQPGTR
jgi:hypothetical protein